MKRAVISASRVVLPNAILQEGYVLVEEGIIRETGTGTKPPADHTLDFPGQILVPGFIDLHVHGADGADFMDGTVEAFATACRAHLRHGTTGLLTTSTAGSTGEITAFLKTCGELTGKLKLGQARVLGAHLYGPYFQSAAKGCHPGSGIVPPVPSQYFEFLKYADIIRTASVAPELPGAEKFVKDCLARGIHCNAGHSHAEFSQVRQAVEWGVRHVDHLFCAMSDRAKLRQTQTYPMRGGLLEATLFFDQLTTEVIADGKHLSDELLALACKIKSPEKLAIVTDSNRAMDQPDGEYWFGKTGTGTLIQKRDGVGVMPDGLSLASGVMGMDQGVRIMARASGLPLEEVIQMATLTPARIAGVEKNFGSIAVGKVGDFTVLDSHLEVRTVIQSGQVAFTKAGAVS
ncbi:MAG: N-acetylglucosamine-6-phosphate deacetylase [Gemmataceae bacterium]|nr:N-acetylglucosamine-6-phosphate deacetylase [Gemmataceae bacterium]